MKCPDCGHENLAGEEACEACDAPLADLGPQPKSRDQKKILEGKISELKPRKAITLGPKDSVKDAVLRMRKEQMGCALITEGSRVTGIFSERDLMLKVAGSKDPARIRLDEAMRPVSSQSLREDDPVAFAFHRMALDSRRHVPIRLRDGSLGIISSRDLLRYLCQ